MTEAVFCSALQKIFKDNGTFPEKRGELHLFARERGSLQLCLRSDRAAELCIDFTSALPLRVWLVNDVPCALPVYKDARRCTLLRDEPGDFPDLLTPFDGTLRAAPGEYRALWLELTAEAAGDYAVTCRISDGGTATELTAAVKVNGAVLPPQTLVYTDWFHADCLATCYNVPVFGEEHWRIIERFMRFAAEHGQNCVLTPLFTPPLDTAVGTERPTVQLVGVTQGPDGWEFDFTLLERWMALAESCGITYFEFAPLFTQWGALCAPKIIADTPEGKKRVFGWETDSLAPEYHAFLRKLGGALTAFTDARGVTQRCYVHCSDEPGEEHFARYERCAALIHEYFGAYRHLDALSHYEFFARGMVPVPVPSENNIGPFVGRVPELWTYYCCGQFNDELPNRFIAFPSIRNRILGALLYKYDCAGFLHWGFNFYYTQLSRAEIDPFKDASSGGAFPCGDAFSVYPGPGGEPLPSLREKVFFDGLQDLRALRAAEQKLGRAAVRRLMAETLGDIDFSHYPMDEETFFRFRNAVWNRVAGC